MTHPASFFKPGPFDALLGAADQALRTLWATPHARRPMPAADSAAISLDDAQRREAQRAGAAELPEPLKRLMALSGRVMTTVAHRV